MGSSSGYISNCWPEKQLVENVKIPEEDNEKVDN